MAITVQKLSGLPFFARLGAEPLRWIVTHIQERTYSARQVIILEGARCEAVYFVAQGVVRTCRLSLDGREQVLAYLGPGQPFNLVPALDRGLNPATVDALTQATLYTIPCERFHLLMRYHHEVALAVVEHLAGEVRRLSDMVEDLALHTVRTRVARLLLAQASDGLDEGAEGTRMPQRQWTQEEIAVHIGTVREMVGRTLRTFATEGLIRHQRGQVVVLDREGLAREAAME